MKKTTDKILMVRFRLDFDGLCSLGRGKVQLLEGIERTGSLSQAARDMDMSYRRAWLLLDSMNHSFDVIVASTNAGGRGGGGAVLTEFGKQLVTTYRDLEMELTDITRQRVRDIASRVRPTGRQVKPAVVSLSSRVAKPEPSRPARKGKRVATQR